MMIPATLLLTGLLSLKTGKVISYLIIGLSIIGLIGSIYLAQNNIYQIYPKERSLIDAIKKTPSESIILSTQANLTVVDFYGQRRYGQLVTDKELSKQEFEALVDKKLEELSRDKEISYDPDFLQSSLEYTFLPGRRVKIHKSYIPGTPVYLAYSYKKTGGLNDLRDYRQSVVDSNNKFTYEKLGYEVIFKDEAGILIKLK